MSHAKLSSVAKAIVAKQKGVLAAGESKPTIKKRFDAIKVESTEKNRRRYREILFTSGWQVSFSYGRALQAPVLATWQVQETNMAAAQKTFLKRCHQ